MTDLCKFTCSLNDHIDDKNPKVSSLINPLFIDDKHISLPLVGSSILCIGISLITILLAKGKIFEAKFFLVLSFLLIIAGGVILGFFYNKLKEKITDKNKELNFKESVKQIYKLNIAFWGCWSFLFVFTLGMSILSSYGLHVIIEGNLFGICLNYGLLLIPIICWSILYTYTKDIECKSKYFNNDEIPNGTLPICSIDENYSIALQNIYGCVVCGLIIILGIIILSLIL
tara:strand:- start:978 stop:1664 length:687 start_codon:yes stop_codon:yes gene_type:complete